MLISQTVEEVALIQSLINNCSLEEIQLVASEIKTADADVELVNPFNVTMHHPHTHASLKEGFFLADATFKLEAVDSASPPNLVFRIACTYRVRYLIKSQFAPSSEQLSAFTKGVTVFNCWAYVREYYQNTAARMGHAPPPLPLLQFRRAKPKAATPNDPLEPSTAPATE
jgi:hypothetical protein